LEVSQTKKKKLSKTKPNIKSW